MRSTPPFRIPSRAPSAAAPPSLRLCASAGLFLDPIRTPEGSRTVAGGRMTAGSLFESPSTPEESRLPRPRVGDSRGEAEKRGSNPARLTRSREDREDRTPMAKSFATSRLRVSPRCPPYTLDLSIAPSAEAGTTYRPSPRLCASAGETPPRDARKPPILSRRDAETQRSKPFPIRPQRPCEPERIPRSESRLHPA